MGTIEKNLSF